MVVWSCNQVLALGRLVLGRLEAAALPEHVELLAVLLLVRARVRALIRARIRARARSRVSTAAALVTSSYSR